MSRGVLLFAHNNDAIDYGSIAMACALMVKRYMGDIQIALVTDTGTIHYMWDNLPDLMGNAFDSLETIEYKDFKDDDNVRKYRDSPWTVRELKYHNSTRTRAYALSPFDETILLDVDYLVQNDTLNMCWGSLEDLMINREAVALDRKPLSRPDVRLDTMSIPLYWATAVYFRKTPRAALFFDLVLHIQDNYEYYSLVYGYPRRPYRNDYAFSIAVHMLNGFSETEEVKPLPVPRILTSLDSDVLIDAPKRGRLQFLVNDSRENWRNYVTNVDGINVHCMNKFSLARHAQQLLDIYA